MRRQARLLRPLHREIFLVGAHGGADHLRRQVQEGRVHVTQDRGRPFGQAADLVQQAIILDQLQTTGETQGARALQDARLALLRVQHHEMRRQAGGVVVEIVSPEGPAVAHEPVAFSQIAALYALDGRGHDLPIEHAQDPPQRPHPAQGQPPPLHRLGPGEIAHDGLDHLGDDLWRRPALARQAGEPHPVPLDQLVAGQARRAQKAVDGRVRRAHAGAFALLMAVSLRRGQPLDHQGQAARACERGQGLGQEPGFRQAFARHPLQITRGLGLHTRRDFLGQQFEQQLGHGLSCHPECGKGFRRFDGEPDLIGHTYSVSQYIFIAEPDHPIALAVKPGGSFQIVELILWQIVSRAVDFDDQAGGMAGEVRNIAPDRRLPSDTKLQLLELSPKQLFRQCHVLPQTPRPGDSACQMMGSAHLNEPSNDSLPPRWGKGGDGGVATAFEAKISLGAQRVQPSPTERAPPPHPPPSRGRASSV